MSVVQKEIADQITELKEKLESNNDGQSILKHLALNCATTAKTVVKNASSTQSIDERIDILVSGLQQIVNQIEEQATQTTETVENIKLKITTLDELLEKIVLIENDEKKNN